MLAGHLKSETDGNWQCRSEQNLKTMHNAMSYTRVQCNCCSSSFSFVRLSACVVALWSPAFSDSRRCCPVHIKSAEYSMPCDLHWPCCQLTHTHHGSIFLATLYSSFHVLRPFMSIAGILAFFSMVFPWLRYSSPDPSLFRWFSLSVFPRTLSLLVTT